eukprot:TRINITY_DN24587_c0_g1_i1.p3 TRINITY_DN24587_c0_g1~~TRINITY_DN24587_c0_g1_i1.p3  ORF type:complete len:104 (-),score=3.11 TRINITY_DN24587_c0_g1_i1:11-322(-)
MLNTVVCELSVTRVYASHAYSNLLFCTELCWKLDRKMKQLVVQKAHMSHQCPYRIGHFTPHDLCLCFSVACRLRGKTCQHDAFGALWCSGVVGEMPCVTAVFK